MNARQATDRVHYLYRQLQTARGDQVRYGKIFDLYISAIRNRDRLAEQEAIARNLQTEDRR